MILDSDTVTELALKDIHDSVLLTYEVERISANSNALDDLISQSQLRAEELRASIVETDSAIDEKTPIADKLDYALAASCGVLTGLIDIFLVGKPGESPLGEWTDKQFDEAVKKFARFSGWNPGDGNADGLNSAIGYLEKKFKVNYDQIHWRSLEQVVKDLTPKNHHMKSLGHSPDIFGLFFSILDQFRGTSTFISRGEIIIGTADFELKGNSVPAKIFCGFCNWFGHLISDMAGSSGSALRGTRGAGISMPFYEFLGMLEFGSIGEDKQTIAQLMTKVYEEGYDFRFMATQAIPVGINEVLIRFIYMLKRHYYHHLSWKDSLPFGNNPTLQRMLLAGQGTLEAIDIADAVIRGVTQQNPVEFVLRLNIVGVGRVSLLLFGEVKNDVARLQLMSERSHLVHELMNEQGIIAECRIAQNWHSLYGAFDAISRAALETNNLYTDAFAQLVSTHESTDAFIEKLGSAVDDLKQPREK